MASTGNRPSDQRTPKPPKWPELRYGIGRCKRCRELDKLKFEPKPDDHNYIYHDDDFNGDEELMLRVIHYRRKCHVTGRFDIDCPPPGYGHVYSREHYYTTRDDRDFNKKLEKSVKFVIDTYNEQKGQELILLGILNVNLEYSGSHLVFYVTFEGFNPSYHQKRTDTSYVQIYRTRVSFACWRWPFPDYKISVFRRSNSAGKDEDLLPPDSYYEESTRVKKELMWTLAG